MTYWRLNNKKMDSSVERLRNEMIKKFQSWGVLHQSVYPKGPLCFYFPD